ncbi:helix-turn-helix domain-containing protein [Synechococcus sp. CC9605]|uniref:helix-turn-helix domain-containing protein n=1 Tax=Synechococcus sp. (strain CC9605) TaxID=110662 RepID=UPI00005D5BD5|nr:helix-turn-helix domain-containing protein [Synechococcus sp. CC9605]ABB35456.1 conserved hypothetical protein [Synechococcus sp. CC9605]
MDTAHQWVSESEAAELLAIKNSTIRTMRRDGRLPPGDHFIFATGTAGGPVTYNVTAIRQSMAERTKELVEAEAKRRAETQQQYLGPHRHGCRSPRNAA